MTVKPIPDGFGTVTPYLLVEGVDRLATFMRDAFGGVEQARRGRPDGTIMHLEMRIGDSMVMAGEPMGEFGPMPGQIFLYVEDCDAVYAEALRAGGESVMELTTMKHNGERYGGVKDPSGNIWWVGTHVADVSAEEEARLIEEHWPDLTGDQ